MNFAIKAYDLGKVYKLGQTIDRVKTFRELMSETPLKIINKLSGKKRAEKKDSGLFWALRELDLEVKIGEVVGIIGANGAGKSTLLKLLSKITAPTTGSAEIRGRVGTLLEVGTGFHPELTGSENIYLNGVIIGMKKKEIDRKFDEIVSFAEIEQFLDTPVKRYSSGMFVRLAFAVAAHLDPEILIVDEVLAVGDAQFQKKCIGKMKDVSSEGRTVLFVSHNMTAIQNLCTRALILDRGRGIFQGGVESAISNYLGLKKSGSFESLKDIPRSPDHLGTSLKFVNFKIFNSDNEETAIMKFGEGFSIEFEVETYQNINNISFAISIETVLNTIVTHIHSEEQGLTYKISKGEKVRMKATFKEIPLNVGYYSIQLKASTFRKLLDRIKIPNELEISSLQKNSHYNKLSPKGILKVFPEWEFNVEKESPEL